mgnify:FL=1
MDFFIKIIYSLLSPYSLITSLRNFLYDYKIFKSKKYKNKVISVGNLIMGGSGKSPMIEFLANHLIKKNKSFSIVSRGYKRKTRGLIQIGEDDNFLSVGDEPMQFFKKFKDNCDIYVSERRQKALDIIEKNNVSYVLLDDAFQNRGIQKFLDIMLSSVKKPFYKDNVFPYGRLRELRHNANRADIIIFTKCDKDISKNELELHIEKSRKYVDENIPILFSYLEYEKPEKLFGEKITDNVLILSSIAYPDEFYNYVKSKYSVVDTFKFADHHTYSRNDISNILKKIDKSITLFTTEKDAVKLCEFGELLSSYNVYYIPIKMKFLSDSKLLKFIS